MPDLGLHLLPHLKRQMRKHDELVAPLQLLPGLVDIRLNLCKVINPERIFFISQFDLIVLWVLPTEGFWVTRGSELQIRSNSVHVALNVGRPRSKKRFLLA
jgi:hypothetical protein